MDEKLLSSPKDGCVKNVIDNRENFNAEGIGREEAAFLVTGRVACVSSPFLKRKGYNLISFLMKSL